MDHSNEKKKHLSGISKKIMWFDILGGYVKSCVNKNHSQALAELKVSIICVIGEIETNYLCNWWD